MFCKKLFFYFNFLSTLFPKIMPNFWQTGAPHIHKIQWFPLSILVFGQKSCFLGPTIYKIPQPNWHYYTRHNANSNCFQLFIQTTTQVLIFIKEIFTLQYNELWFARKCRNCTFKVNFLCQKLTEFFQKKK